MSTWSSGLWCDEVTNTHKKNNEKQFLEFFLANV